MQNSFFLRTWSSSCWIHSRLHVRRKVLRWKPKGKSAEKGTTQNPVILCDFNLQMLKAASSRVSGSPFQQTNHINQRIAHQLTSTWSKIWSALWCLKPFYVNCVLWFSYTVTRSQVSFIKHRAAWTLCLAQSNKTKWAFWVFFGAVYYESCPCRHAVIQIMTDGR